MNKNETALRPRMIQFKCGAGLTLLGFVVMCLARLDYIELRSAIAAAVASTGFLVAGSTRESLRTTFGKIILAGLLCCWAGDLLGPVDFLWGVYAFMAGHAVFVYGFVCRGCSVARMTRAASPVIVVGFSVTTWLWTGISAEERYVVLAYTLIITCMAIAAIGTSRSLPSLTAAALLFYASDIFLALWRYAEAPMFAWFCYPLYLTACVLFAYSAIAASRIEARKYADAVETDEEPPQ